jgi:hypothetical protein
VLLFFWRAIFAACLPRAVRVLFGRCAIVLLRRAAAAAFLMLRRAADRWRKLMSGSSLSQLSWVQWSIKLFMRGAQRTCHSDLVEFTAIHEGRSVTRLIDLRSRSSIRVPVENFVHVAVVELAGSEG